MLFLVLIIFFDFYYYKYIFHLKETTDNNPQKKFLHYLLLFSNNVLTQCENCFADSLTIEKFFKTFIFCFLPLLKIKLSRIVI